MEYENFITNDEFVKIDNKLPKFLEINEKEEEVLWGDQQAKEMFYKARNNILNLVGYLHKKCGK